MENKKKMLIGFLSLAIIGSTGLSLKITAQAKEVEIPGYCEYTDSNEESIAHWYGIARGTYLSEGICGVKRASSGKVSVSGTTFAHSVCDTVKVGIYLDESSDGGKSFGQIGSYYFSENNTTSCHGSKADISVKSGWTYRARGGHSVTKGSTTETTNTRSNGIVAS